MEANPYIYMCPVFEDYHDPLAARRALVLGSDGQFNAWLSEQRSPDAVTAMRAHEKIIPLVRAVFKLPAVDRATGAGVADQQALDVLNHFLSWLEGKA